MTDENLDAGRHAADRMHRPEIEAVVATALHITSAAHPTEDAMRALFVACSRLRRARGAYAGQGEAPLEPYPAQFAGLLERCCLVFRPDSQLTSLTEECGELAAAAARVVLNKASVDAMMREAADVQLLLWQLGRLYPHLTATSVAMSVARLTAHVARREAALWPR